MSLEEATVDRVVFWLRICARPSNAAPALLQDLIEIIARLPLRRALPARPVLPRMPRVTIGSTAALHDFMRVLVFQQNEPSYSCAPGELEHAGAHLRRAHLRVPPPALEHLTFALLDWAAPPRAPYPAFFSYAICPMPPARLSHRRYHFHHAGVLRLVSVNTAGRGRSSRYSKQEFCEFLLIDSLSCDYRPPVLLAVPPHQTLLDGSVAYTHPFGT
ncbi:uncharacterized protein C8Q71DRAFT_780604 [Rhodofomes roseus]|uniref:Uncharacterized protein n=1 Tax=Rhodofomes roseus TaxID=34475 RepID=A0ABQ8K4M3_9APHY|nr:uncharacterized protein C8Q71DRAFT_780604 [Rhodofomes roseus]KAH9831820.1 hypothetical protein C8Q71DRAFT_780604 [Rhodofomes roseus]